MKLTKLLPHPLALSGLLWLFIGTIYFKFLYFDLLWALDSTFSGFQFWVGYMTKLAFATLLASPILLWRSRWYAMTICLVLDAWLIANLMYFRTYFTVIPAASYGLVGNLADFTDSVWESFRWADIIFPLSTGVLMFELSRTKVHELIRAHWRKTAKWLAILFGTSSLFTGIYIAVKGGYKAAYDDLMYDFSMCGAAVYTIPGAMSYEYIKGAEEFTPEVQSRVDAWLAERPGQGFVYAPDTTRHTPDNAIILLLESFESWPIGLTLEGQEITPNINRLVADTTVFYAPKVQSQVKGARSIDAQLIIHTGLLPVDYGAYSYRFVHNTYPSIDKAWKEVHGTQARTASFTVDKRTVWNVATVAQDFGYELYDKPHWVLDVKTGPRGRLGDDSFLRQSYAQIADNTFWPADGHTLVQCVTYSGHTPFVIGDELKKVHFSDAIPERLRHYLEVANYTDRAVGALLDSLATNPKFSNTAVIITGDHEGVGADRTTFVKNPETAKWLSSEQFVPLIVVNGTAGGHYEGVMGQVDIYPTLLDLLGLRAYWWHGLGQSVLDPSRAPFALTAQGRFVGDASTLDESQKKHARTIYDISNLMITTDYFKHVK